GGGAGASFEPRDHAQYPPEPVPGVFLQRGNGAGCGRDSLSVFRDRNHSDLGQRGDERQFAVGRRQCAAVAKDTIVNIDRKSGDGTLYATPGEFVRDVLRDKKERLEAAQIREAILDGYRDALEGRTVAYRGDLRRLLKSDSGPRF